MSWLQYHIIFKLKSHLHIGYRKTGNLMQTRSYVPGKNLWAALTARITRDMGDGKSGSAYKKTGCKIKKNFRFSYFWPAIYLEGEKIEPENNKKKIWDKLQTHFTFDISDNGELEKIYPLKGKSNKFRPFDYLFLDSYASTSLDYQRQGAEEGSLHEAEFISPVTRDGRQVYLAGSIWVKEGELAETKCWKESLAKISIGGEQKYGWGRLELIMSEAAERDSSIQPDGFDWNGYVPSHLHSEDTENIIQGPLEPLVGWDTDVSGEQKISDALIAFSPGIKIDKKVSIENYGLWKIKSL